MLIPLKAETPNCSGATEIGHFPWITLALIAANIAVSVCTGFGREAAIRPFALEYGQGCHPTQWLTHIFLHLGPVHLVGNMLFLWVFGMVVEGRLGWWKFLLAYLAVGAADGALEQLVLFNEGWSVGASGVIYGLLAMALLWAPETEIQCVWIGGYSYWMTSSEVEISVLWMAIWYIGFELLKTCFFGFHAYSPVYHLIGAGFGLLLGIVFMKLKWVDCEGWDLLSMAMGRHMRKTRRRASVAPTIVQFPLDALEGPDSDDAASPADRSARNHAQLRQLLAEKNGAAALRVYERAVSQSGRLVLSETELLQMIDLLSRDRNFDATVGLLEEYLQRFDSRAAQGRLKLAQMLIEHQQRPAYALRVLSELHDAGLAEKHRKLRRGLERKAQQMIDEGVLELQGRAW